MCACERRKERERTFGPEKDDEEEYAARVKKKSGPAPKPPTQGARLCRRPDSPATEGHELEGRRTSLKELEVWGQKDLVGKTGGKGKNLTQTGVGE
jgi:hypothetical protein